MATATFQPDATAGKDTYIVDASPTSNNDAAASGLIFGYIGGKTPQVFRAIISIDLFTDIGGGAVPAGSAINSAQWDLRHVNDAYGVGVNTADVYRQDRITRSDWAENQVTWNIYKTANNWTTAGGDIDGGLGHTFTLSNGGASAPATYTIGTSAGFVALVQDAVDSRSGILIVRLKAVTESGTTTQTGVASSDDATSTNRPKLTIDYTAPTAAAFNRNRMSQVV